MILDLLQPIYRRWQAASLSAKIILPIVGLMIVSLLLSTFAFVFGTDRTQTQLLQQAVSADMTQVAEALTDRTQTVKTASEILAKDTEIAQALSTDTADALLTINRRAVALRERLNLDLVQIYNHNGEARTNLLLSNLFRQSSLLNVVQAGPPQLRSVDGRLLLLSRADMADGAGAVVTGLDLESELHRVSSEYGLRSNITVRGGGLQIGADKPGLAAAADVQDGDRYTSSETIRLGDAPLELALARPTDDIRRVTLAGLTVMITSTVLTTILLIVVAIAITRLVVKPVHRLAEAAQSIARGDLRQQSELTRLAQSHQTPSHDEIVMLAQSLDYMVTELGSLYQELEDKVVDRTRQMVQAQERYRRFFDEDLAGDFICDPTGQILACNPAFVRIFGFSSVDDVLSHNIGDFYASQDARHTFWELLTRRRKLEYHEAQLRGKNGQSVDIVQNVIATFDKQGNLVEVKGYILDNSERKKLEEQLRQSQKMEAIGRLAGGIAHDFNNLLTVIIGYSKLLQWSFLEQNGVDETMAKQLETIKTAGERAAMLTRQLLAFSRKQVLEPRVISLNDVVGNLDGILRRLIGEHLEMIVSKDARLGQVNADPGQIEQVIMNLAVNARDAMPDGGKLIIETANVVLDKAYASRHIDVQSGHYTLLAVSDTGMGIDPEVIELIFEPFFTTKDSGTGLGLATVYGIVKQSGGHIAVYSEVGQGATFKVYLPRVDAAEVSESEEPEALDLNGSETVLLVEDEDMVRAFAAEVLRQRGYHVLQASHGRDALQLISQNPEEIHLILTDVIMPGMNGRDMANRLQLIYPQAKVLFMSGYTDSAIVHHGVLDPGTHCIQKPFQPDALAQKVQQVLHGSEKLSGSQVHTGQPILEG